MYLLDTNGRVLATSNWSDPDSYLGEDLSFRAYWQDAMKGKPGRFYGIGSTRGEPGYYLAHGLVHGGRIIGVAVVKVKMDASRNAGRRRAWKPSSATRTASSSSPATPPCA